MQPILKSCCGLDVHKSMILACIAHGPLDKPPKFEIRKFPTMTNDLRKLSEWMKEYGVNAPPCWRWHRWIASGDPLPQ